MKKASVMVVAALLSASMFAATASLPKKPATVNGSKPKTEMSKDHKQKGATPKTHKASKKTSTKSAVKK